MNVDEPNDRDSGSNRVLPKRIDLNLLTVFEAIWQERNVAQAAARLALSQPATSHALSRLRRIVGDPLFERAPGGMRPSARAEAMWPAVAHALDHARRAFQPAFDPAGLGRRIRIGMTTNVAMTLVGGMANIVQAGAPGPDLSLVPIDRRRVAEMLARAQIDAMVGLWTEELPTTLMRVPVYQEPLAVFARQGHSIFARDLTPERFASFPQVLVSPSGDASGPVDSALARRGLRRRIAMIVADYGLAARALTRSDLIGVLGTRALADTTGYEALRSTRLPFDVAPFAIDLIVPQSAPQLAAWLSDVISRALEPGSDGVDRPD
ncbi:MAG: LysR substrate-binding domain-containing protein [Pseudomonadota bacterium]